MIRSLSIVLAAGLALAASPVAAATTARDREVPHYDHIIVIVEENKGYSTILDRPYAPYVKQLAHEYGSATQMYAESHPSEPNYVAMLGGDTFGIADDAPWFSPGHLVDAPNLGSQLRAKGLRWRAYLEDIPAPGSLAIVSPENENAPAALYAAKHTGFTNFASVHHDPDLAHELVGFGELRADLKSGEVPAFSFVVPNQCDEMHGIRSPKSPPDCTGDDLAALVKRGDDHLNALVSEIQRSPIWTSPREQTAIVVTWDENGGEDRTGGIASCCVPVDAHNPGGGRIPTVVITNHGPRGVSDPTPYDHYSLLRTVEDALGLDDHVGHADDAGVLPMVPLFGPLRR